MKSIQAFSRFSSFVIFSAYLVTSLALSPLARADDAPVIPLPAEMAKDLELLGKGVVGKALPAPPITDVLEYANLGPGTWDYEIVAGGKDGAKVRSEHYAKHPEKKGDAQIWKHTIGTEFVEYVTIDTNHDFGKHLEDDLELGYSSRFKPGVMWMGKTKAGETRTIESKIESFKTAKPEHISYTGKLTAKLSYVGQYEVTTPAGTFPAILMRAEFDIKVGPAKVTDTAYNFYTKGVGKVAELESTFVSALLVYHSDTRVAKLLTKYPKR